METTGHDAFKELVKERKYNVDEILHILNLVDDKKMNEIVSYLKGNYDY